MDKNIENYVYRKDVNRPEKRCCFQIWRTEGRWGNFARCSRKTKEMILDYGFCSQHALEIKKNLDLTIENKKTKYVVGIDQYGVPWMVKFTYQQETKKNFKVLDSNRVCGYTYLGNLISKFHPHYDSFEEAKNALISRFETYKKKKIVSFETSQEELSTLKD